MRGVIINRTVIAAARRTTWIIAKNIFVKRRNIILLHHIGSTPHPWRSSQVISVVPRNNTSGLRQYLKQEFRDRNSRMIQKARIKIEETEGPARIMTKSFTRCVSFIIILFLLPFSKCFLLPISKSSPDLPDLPAKKNWKETRRKKKDDVFLRTQNRVMNINRRQQTSSEELPGNSVYICDHGVCLLVKTAGARGQLLSVADPWRSQRECAVIRIPTVVIISGFSAVLDETPATKSSSRNTARSCWRHGYRRTSRMFNMDSVGPMVSQPLRYLSFHTSCNDV